MTLIPFWKGEIRLPSHSFKKKKVGKNYVSRLSIQEYVIEATLFDGEYTGYYEIQTNLENPFHLIYLKKKRANNNPNIKRPILSCSLNDPINELSIDAKLKWKYIPEFLLKELTPEQIVDSWKGKFVFKEEYEEANIPGLRSAQLGALHAVSAHFSIGSSFDPATIVMPTGTGKTETMLATLAYRRLPRVLILVPSNVLRKQLSEKFLKFGILPLIGVLPYSIERPWVAIIKKNIQTIEEAQKLLENSNAIIATPNILACSNKDAVKELINGCTDLFIDEAHHSPANTWDKIRDLFLNKRVSQFTATPFRNDEKEVGGKIIFNYKLGDAQKDGYYKSIRFYPIEEYGAKRECDLKVARKAIEILRGDLENRNKSFDHLIMARTNDKENADELAKIYIQLAPDLNPVVVHTGKSKSENEQSLSKILDRSSRIVICVDMLGEGFDLPELKIAAIHEYHKSLAITLQFIGRFTRKSKNVGDAAVVLNIADPEVEKGLGKLYSANAAWDDIIMRLSEERIEREIKLQDLIENLKQNGTLSHQISLRNLRPTFTTQIYKVNVDEWDPLCFKDILPKKMKHYHSLSISQKILIILGVHENDVKWGKLQGINDILHKLFIAYWNKEESSLFIYCNDYNGFRVEMIVNKLFNNKAELVTGSKIFNVLNNVQLPLAKNLGSSKTGVISFTQYFGPDVTKGLSEIEKKESNLSNIACLGYEEGERVLWGAAQRKGKIWSMNGGTIDEWMDWCNRIWIKVNSDTLEDNITKNFLRPLSLSTYHTEPAISIEWGEKLQLKSFDKVSLIIDEMVLPLYLVDIDINNIGCSNPIEIKISSEEIASIYTFEINENLDGGYKYSLINGPKVYFKIGRSDPKSLEEYIVADPFIINYSDGSNSYHKYLIQPNLEPDAFDADSIEEWDWENIPLNQESMGKEQKQDTIQYRTFKMFANEYDLIINDDGKGEAGDLVCLTIIDDRTINLTLVHCKNAINNRPGADIRDLYTVCGQAQKSIKIKHKGLKELYKEIKNREARWQQTGHSRFLKGSIKDLEFFKNKSRTSKIDFNVIVVQPGISKSAVSPDILRLLATTELYIKKTCQGGFRIIANH
ncbi:MAG: DEAD/DEAH box helicase family protein [Candidatus Cloacimonetes bacterium]|nr:DEAD/DEAH box helicase family protein [Candidatus Cloacimonadota bacterium]